MASVTNMIRPPPVTAAVAGGGKVVESLGETTSLASVTILVDNVVS